LHLEERYGAEEVRNNWYFEVWNEATWMYGPGAAGYNELYRNTALGPDEGRSGGQGRRPRRQRWQLAQRDPGLIDFVRAAPQAAEGLKLDFLTYHHYARDDVFNRPGANSDAGGFVLFKRDLMTLIATRNFTGEVINDEWGPGYDPSCRATPRRRPASSRSRSTSSAPTRRRACRRCTATGRCRTSTRR
jgi:hypothetical protein